MVIITGQAISSSVDHKLPPWQSKPSLPQQNDCCINERDDWQFRIRQFLRNEKEVWLHTEIAKSQILGQIYSKSPWGPLLSGDQAQYDSILHSQLLSWLIKLATQNFWRAF